LTTSAGSIKITLKVYFTAGFYLYRGENFMYCISISHKTSDVTVRKKLAFSDEQKKAFLDRLFCSESISECLVLCTCNRTEVYFCGDKGSVKTVETVLSDFSQIDFDELKKYIYLFYGDKALLHLFRVAGGIESMVIGEDEILGQLKRAYAFAKENGTVAYELNMCVQAAVACAKKIKTETALSKTSVSVATLATNEAVRFGNGSLNVLVIGATGKAGSTVVKNLLSHRDVTVTVTSRKHKAESVFENTGARVIDYDSRYSAFDTADCIISATSGPHYTVTYYDLKSNIKTEKERLFIDLAVPPDIDENVEKITGARLVNIDCIKQLARENNALKLDSVESAKEIISDEIETLKKDLAFHEFLPCMESVKNAMPSDFSEKFIYKLKSDVSSEEFSRILEIYRKCGENN